MITRVTIRNLKRLRDAVFEIGDHVVFAGPNNFGKTTALQALSIWNLASQRWREVREKESSQAKERTGVAITRPDFTAAPVLSFDMLWTGRAVGRRKGERRPPLVEVIVEGKEGQNAWIWGMELQYAMPEAIHCRPVHPGPVPDAVKALTVVHVPPLGGIQTNEEVRKPGIQDKLIGEGRPGEILRNLLLDLFEKDKDGWAALRKEILNLFTIDLQPPEFTGTYIVCEYLPARLNEKRAPKPYEIASAGSGFHQILLLLAFFHARPGSVLLLDEPDAHLHVILQKEIYSLLRRVASERRSQLVISTHSEVILDDTDPQDIVAFTGKKPHRLINTSQKAQLRRALTRLRSLDFVLADQVKAVLYVEGETDAAILREWARVLNHPAQRFLSQPFLHPLGGNNLGELKEHYFALKDAYPELKGAAVLDRTLKTAPEERLPELFYWNRREIENYLLVPSALDRYVVQHALLGEFARSIVRNELATQLPAAFDPFDDRIVFLRDVKASEEFLLPLLERCQLSTSKKDLFLLAAAMKPDEIHPEVKKALDLIATLNPPPQDPEQPARDASDLELEE